MMRFVGRSKLAWMRWSMDKRQYFPQLVQKPYGKDLVYFDSGATAMTCQPAIDAMMDYYTNNSASVHRGANYLSDIATDKFEAARKSIQEFVGAKDVNEIIFTKGTTDGLNLLASSFGGSVLKPQDEVLVTEMEHHANLIPWQQICAKTGATLKIWPITAKGELDSSIPLEERITDQTKIIAVTQTSNALGTNNPICDITQAAHAKKAYVVVDAAQSVPHLQIDVVNLDADFLVFSSHKMFGPTGVGALWGRKELLDAMPPYQTGGHMVEHVTLKDATFAPVPTKFEAGTQAIAEVIGFGAAAEFLSNLDRDALHRHELNLMERMVEGMKKLPGVRIFGEATDKSAIVSFAVNGVHPHDISSIVDRSGVAIRAGHLCCQPVMQKFGVSAFARASIAFYNTEEEVDVFLESLKNVGELFHGR